MYYSSRMHEVHGTQLVVKDGDDVGLTDITLGTVVEKLLEIGLSVLHDDEQVCKLFQVHDGVFNIILLIKNQFDIILVEVI